MLIDLKVAFEQNFEACLENFDGIYREIGVGHRKIISFEFFLKN
jgi:enamine deaminase RidA (YjgF/YER057c/UK114 family)